MKNQAITHNLRQLLISFDQLLQVIIGCIVSLFLWNHRIDADETMSAYCYRHNKYWYGEAMEVFINALMYIPERLIYKLPWGHCKRSYVRELIRVYDRMQADHPKN